MNPMMHINWNSKNVKNDNPFRVEIYNIFHNYILRSKTAQMWGFPFIDQKGRLKHLSNKFSKSPKSQTEECRCGKKINLQDENWHVDDNGCMFHPGKSSYSEKDQDDVYTCCGKKVFTSGCVRRTHHVSSARACRDDKFVRTFAKDRSFLQHIPNIFALDCEMVYTTKGMEVVKVTVLSVFCDVVYDTLVKPSHPVIDYNTEFSGIDKHHLANVIVGLEDVQSILLELFDTGTILVGHGLENDLLCLNLFHAKLIDTSILFPHKKGFPYRHSLKHLAKTYLSKQIHCGFKGHDSREDARTCLELIARKIFFSKTRRIKFMNTWNPRTSRNMLCPMLPNPMPNNTRDFGIPDMKHLNHPMVYMNYRWTTTYPGYYVTRSILYPCGYLNMHTV